MTTLHVDWATHEAASYAVRHWHYSRSMPAGKLTKVGAWEDERFIGVVLFGRGAAIHIGRPFGLEQTEVCELVRVALDTHVTPVSRIVAIALRMLRKLSPSLRLVVSFADTDQGHHGGIYQAGGWLYIGDGSNDTRYRVHGEVHHPKTLHSMYGRGGQSLGWLRAHVDPHAEVFTTGPKRKYAMPLDPAMRAALAPLARPYPKRALAVVEPTPALHVGAHAPESSSPVGTTEGEGGAAPTPALRGST